MYRRVRGLHEQPSRLVGPVQQGIVARRERGRSEGGRGRRHPIAADLGGFPGWGTIYFRGEIMTIDDLFPVERLALSVALAQVLRGEQPAPGGASTCVLALARLVGKHDWTTHASTSGAE